MILRKPYAMFIKLFRPIHFIFVFCIGILIYYQNRILSFFNNYLYTSEVVSTDNIKQTLFSNYLYLIPIFLIVLSLLLFGIMFRKNKPYKYYFISIFLFLVILVLNIYVSNFLTVFQDTTVTIKSVKLIHDLVLMSILLESVLLVIYIIRGLGVDFKHFNFDSDISKLDIDEKDKEEFELDLKFDFNETKRKRKERLRNFKYLYLENKFLINLIVSVISVMLIIIVALVIIKHNSYNKEGKEYNLDSFNIIVEETNILNTNYEGNRITDNYLIVVKARLKSYNISKSLYSKDFTLKFSNAKAHITKEYNNYLSDIGKAYNNENLTNEYETYLFVYELPKKFITSDMFLSYNNLGYDFDIKLNPKNLTYGNKAIKSKIKKTLNFNDSLGDISFKIKDYDINDFYEINYDYCISNDNCLESKEYLRPSIDENFDKTILKLDVDYTDNTKLNLSNFYNLLEKFGDIYYKKDDHWEIQDDDFEQIVSNRGSNYYLYIGVNNEIKDASNIKFVFNIRGIKYEYILK